MSAHSLPGRTVVTRTDAPASPVSRLRARVRASPWATLGRKVSGYVAAFVALDAVGSGEATGWLASLGPRPSHGASGPEPSRGAVATLDLGGAPSGVDDGARDGGAAEGRLADAGHESRGDAGASPDDAGASAGITADGKVILNRADETELRRLPGVGPTKARAIVELRARLGRFRRPEDLLRVKGIGRRSLARLRPLVVVDAPG